MYDDSSLLPSAARQVIDDRVRHATEARRARAARPHRRHRLAEQLRSVAERLDA